MREKSINKKDKIIKSYRADSLPSSVSEDTDIHDYDSSYGNIHPYWVVKNKGRLSKSKIHCSCYMCSFHETSVSDKRKLMSMNEKLEDYVKDECEWAELGLSYATDVWSYNHASRFKNKVIKKLNKSGTRNNGLCGTRLGNESANPYVFYSLLAEKKVFYSLLAEKRPKCSGNIAFLASDIDCILSKMHNDVSYKNLDRVLCPQDILNYIKNSDDYKIQKIAKDLLLI